MLRLDGSAPRPRAGRSRDRPQSAFGVDADEHAGAGDVGRIIGDRAILEGGERRLDLAEPLVDFVRELVGALVFGFELGVFGVQRVDRRLLLGRQFGRRAFEFAQAMGMAVRETRRRDLDPLPALGGDLLRLRLQLLGDQAVEQGQTSRASRRRPAGRGRA